MDIEELESVDESVENSYLYSDILYHKVNSKLKQLRVNLRRGIAADGSRVFNLDIRGIKHNYRFHLDFTPRELCFLRFEEFQDNVKEPSCWSCINRNYYPTLVYSRILLIFYLEADIEHEAQCIKVPFIQRGNVNSVLKLRKLQEVIFHNVVSADELKHWQVSVVRCGDRVYGERVCLCLTKYAFVIVLNHTIYHYHAFHCSNISVQCFHDSREIEFTVHDKSLIDASEGTENFSLHKVYTFKTAQAGNIERSFQDLFRKSQFLPRQAPAAHYNIRRSEQSASWQMGTTSDNVTIVPHKPLWHDNNNSGSGGVMIPSSDKISNLKETAAPDAHNSWHTNLAFHSTSSNGSIPGSHSDIFSSHEEVIRHSNLPLYPRGPREKWPDDNDTAAEPNCVNVVQVEINEPDTVKGIKTNSLIDSLVHDVKYDSDPMGTLDRRLKHQKKPSLPNMEDIFMDDDDDLKFVSEEEANDLPPPPPCPAFSQPFGEFPQKNEFSKNDHNFQSVPMTPVVPCRVPNVMLRRSQSFLNVSEPDMSYHFYVNITQEMCSRGSVHDDSPYYRFYYNVGLVRSTYSRISQRKKLERVNRLSKELKEVSVNELNIHEQWYDRDFQERGRDPKFCSIYNIAPDTSNEYDYSRVDEDDQYWTQNYLCITIQRLLEEDPKGNTVFTEVQRALDLTAEQLMEIQVLLSLAPAQSDWKTLAEFIGLSNGDINIIEHFCYSYRKLTAYVVLTHWLFKFHKNESIRPCSRESLLHFVNENGRMDIAAILRSRTENKHIQNVNEILESTHF